MLVLKLTLIIASAVAALPIWLIYLGSREPVSRMHAGRLTWFVATKDPQGTRPGTGLDVLWSSDADFAFIGEDDAYWSQFMIVTGELPVLEGYLPTIENAADAYIAEIALIRPPRIMLGLLRALHLTGLRGAPGSSFDVEHILSYGDGGVLPTRSSIGNLQSNPPDYQPDMVNFLSYRERAVYADGDRGLSGRAAYQIYGREAVKAVYRTGGSLVFFAAVKRVVRPAFGWHSEISWHTLAAMRYRSRDAILTMEMIPEYRAALVDRDAGLEKTVVIASRMRPGPHSP